MHQSIQKKIQKIYKTWTKCTHVIKNPKNPAKPRIESNVTENEFYIMSTNCVRKYQWKNVTSSMKLFVSVKNRYLTFTMNFVNTLVDINQKHIFSILLFCDDVNKEFFILSNVINPRWEFPKRVIYFHKKSADYCLDLAFPGPKVEFLQCLQYYHK